MSLNLLSAMSANTEKYDPRNHLGYRNFRNRGYGGGRGGGVNLSKMLPLSIPLTMIREGDTS